jgi:hypothetical protein
MTMQSQNLLNLFTDGVQDGKVSFEEFLVIKWLVNILENSTSHHPNLANFDCFFSWFNPAVLTMVN